MPVLVIPFAAQAELLAELIDTGNFLDGLKVGLFGNDIVPDEDTLITDLDIVAYSGYAASSLIAWGDPFYRSADGVPAVVGDSKAFRSVTATPYVTGVAYGQFYYLPGTPNVLRAVQRFDTPVVFDKPDRVLVIVPEWTFPGALVS